MQQTKFSPKERLNETYPIALTVLTPVHIGTASEKMWLKNIDYFYEDGKIYVVNQDRLAKAILGEGRREEMGRFTTYTNYLSNGELKKCGEFVRRHVDIKKLAYLVYNYQAESINEIRPLIRSGSDGQTFIPGSSIKGAIRSIIFNYLHKGLQITSYDKRTIEQLLGRFDRSIMRYIRPYDVAINKIEIVDVELFNLYRAGSDWESDYKENFLISAESFQPEATASFTLSIANGLKTAIEQYDKKVLPTYIDKVIIQQNPIQLLFNLINEYTYRHLQKEIAFFRAYPQAEDTDLIIEGLEVLQKQTQNNGDSCILRLAYGSGFHGITGDWRFQNHLDTIHYPDKENRTWSMATRSRQPARYKSRRIADNGTIFMPMGFVKLTLPEGADRIKFRQTPNVFRTKANDILPQKTRAESSKKTENKPPQSDKKKEKEIPDSKSEQLIAYENVKMGTTVFEAKIVKIGKPFCKVKLLIANYPFDEEALEVDMSGTKKAKLVEGQIVKVMVNSQTKDGQIKRVKYQS